MRILVAEDNPINQMVVEKMLEALGFQSHLVSSGDEAIQALSLYDCDLILMDCYMPDRDGFEATEVIRTSEVLGQRNIPIIALTAFAEAANRDRCLKAGMNDFIAKPLNRENLKEKLALWLGVTTKEA